MESDAAKELYNNYNRCKKIVQTYQAKYDALSDAQRQSFEEVVNISHLTNAFSRNDEGMTAYNDSVLEASDLMLYLLLGRENYLNYSLLTSLYDQAVAFAEEEDYTYLSEQEKLIVDASQFSSNAKEDSEGSYEGLIDNDRYTFFHSEWTTNKSNGAYHYLQIDLRDTYENIVLKYSIRTIYNDAEYYLTHGTPKTLHVYVTNASDNENSWIDLGRYTCTYDYVSNDTGLLNLNFDWGGCQWDETAGDEAMIGE